MCSEGALSVLFLSADFRAPLRPLHSILTQKKDRSPSGSSRKSPGDRDQSKKRR